jgi:hypothetical protein
MRAAWQPDEPASLARVALLTEQAVNGSWRVIDRQTGQPAVVRGYMLLGMEMREASERASALSSRQDGLRTGGHR